MKNYFLSALLALTFLGCATHIHPLPKWWTHTPADSAQWLYGIGEGSSLDEAKQQALASIAGQLETRLSAKLSVRTQETNAAFDQYADRNIRTTVADVNFSHFQIIEKDIDEHKQRVRVLVKLNKPALANAWQQQYDKLATQVTSAEKKQPNQSVFDWWRKARGQLKSAARADSIAMQRSILQDTPQPSQLLAHLRKVIKAIPLTVKIEGDNDAINRRIIDLLDKKDLRASSCRQCALILRYRTKTDYEVIYNQQVATMQFFGQLVDDRGVLSESHWRMQGASISQRQVAFKAASALAADKITQQGLWKSFGLTKGSNGYYQ
ncbi:MAG: hypothetical protein CENE_01047 [Candidatus Celerinatantimonas neptuna]|nr:MAG: hypothetical protein CENE_01047 [Candidatus Celerinatantimonas neptuna]